MLLIISTSFVSNVVSNSNNFSLQEDGTKLVQVDSSKPELEVSGSGSFKTYFFTSKPALSESTSDNYSETDIYMYSNEVEAFYLYMNEGSSLQVTWSTSSASHYVDFYILKGQSEYDDFMADNYFDYELYEWGSSEVNSFYADDSDTYYIVWWNYESSYIYLDISIDYILLDYDLALASDSILGEFTQSVSEYNYVVFENTGSSDVSIDYKFSSAGLSGFDVQTWIPIIIIGIGVIAIVRVVSKSKKQTPKKKTGAATGTTSQTSGTVPTQAAAAPSYNPIKAPNATTPVYGQASSSSTPSGGFTMSSRTSYPANQSYTPTPKTYVTNKKLTQVQKDTLESLFKYSNRVFIYDAAAQLRLSRDDLMVLYRNDPDGFKGYRIDGEYLEAVGMSSTTQSSGSGIRYCEVCGNPLDQPSMDRMNKMGSVFCGYCGKKMQR